VIGQRTRGIRFAGSPGAQALTAGFVVVVYLALAILAVSCVASHDGHRAGAHSGAAQHDHSLLCVWACQAGSPDCFSTSVPPAWIVLLALHGVVTAVMFLTEPWGWLPGSRAPPL
jgi:hypothetical protein